MNRFVEKLKKVGKRYGMEITPENFDHIVRSTWEKYRNLEDTNGPKY